jgi:hypothetical protein
LERENKELKESKMKLEHEFNVLKEFSVKQTVDLSENNRKLYESECQVKLLGQQTGVLNRKAKKLGDLSYDRDFFLDNDDRTKHLTGLSTWATLDALYQCVEGLIRKGKVVSKFQSLILTLMKLRLGATDRDMGYRFAISNVSAGRIFHHTLGE